jgi:hypothetical protein
MPISGDIALESGVHGYCIQSTVTSTLTTGGRLLVNSSR